MVDGAEIGFALHKPQSPATPVKERLELVYLAKIQSAQANDFA
jgi:hypothetical protein